MEGRVFARWEESGIFHPEPEGDAAENYSIAVPPPNVTGSLHMGHALNGSIQDVVHSRRAHAREAHEVDLRHRPRGNRHPACRWRRRSRRRARAARRSAASASSSGSGSGGALHGSTITNQFKRLGASLDYADERFTMDDDYVRAVTQVFVRLYEKGLIHRDNYMVNWDPGLRTAISDLEVEQRTVEDTLYLIDYPLESGSGAMTVATVRPGDDAGRHRHRRAPGRRALLAPGRRGGDPAAGRTPAPDHRGRATSTPSSAPARSRSLRGTTPPTSRSAADTASRRSS